MGIEETSIHNETSIYNQTSIHNETSIQSISVSRESSRDAFLITSVVVFGVLIALALLFVCRCAKWCGDKFIATSSGLAARPHNKNKVVLNNTTVERLVLEMADEKPTRFTSEQLAGYTLNYTTRLGAGGFGTVYRREEVQDHGSPEPTLDTVRSSTVFMWIWSLSAFKIS